jgi:hypothetical protein
VHHHRTIRRAVANAFALALAVSLTVAGCSSSGSSSTEAPVTETTAAMATETTAAMAETTAAMAEPAAGDAAAILAGSGTATWMLVSRAEGGKPAAAVECAVDDLLVFRSDGTFDSMINGTKCNPAEVDVKAGAYQLSADGKVITFTVPGFSYTGTLLVATPGRIVIKFDLGPGFVLDDEFILRA